jgi:RNA polymerase sigma-70 factor, ECF subfamily
VTEAFAVADALRRAAAAWPGIGLDPQIFVDHLAARLPQAASLSLPAALAAISVEDLYLACACLRGERAALDAFERAYADVFAKSLARFDLSAAEREDLVQSLRVAFFLKKTLAGYSGRGSLRGWVRTACTRSALDFVESRRARPGDDADDILRNLPATGDVELDLVRQRAAAQVHAALSETIAALAPEDRALLAQHYVDELSIDQLALVYNVHRATVARRLVRLREALIGQTKARLREKLDVDGATLESIVRLATSRLDVSVFRMLRG